MENNSLENKVWEKLEKKMAAENYYSKENINKIGERKMKTKNLGKVVSFSFLAIFLAGNVYTYAKDNKNIFSWMIDKIGIYQKYEENKIDANQSKNSNGYELTLANYAIDKDTLIINFNLKSNEEISLEYPFTDNSNVDFDNLIKIIDADKQYSVSGADMNFMIEKINNKEYNILEICKIDSSKVSENNKLDIDFTLNSKDNFSKLANWNFKVELNNQKNNLDFEEYDVINKQTTFDNTNINLLKIKNSNMATKLTFYLDDIGDSNSLYTVEVLDENDNIILNKDIEYLNFVGIQDVIIKKVELNSKLKVNIYKEENKKEVSKASFELDLSKDLKESKKIEYKKISKVFGDIQLSYYDNAEIFQDSDVENGESLVLQYYDEVNSVKLPGLNIHVNYYKNKFKDKELKEIVNLIINRQFNTDGTEFHPEDFNNQPINELKNLISDVREVKLSNGKINAITYVDAFYRHYIFVMDENIYEIYYEINFDYSDVAQEFIDDINLEI